MRHIRHVQVYPNERISAQRVLTRMGERNIQTIDSLVSSLLINSQGTDATIISGLTVVPQWGMTLSIEAPGIAVQSVPDDEARFATHAHFPEITLDDADPALDRRDSIEARVCTRDAFLDHAVPFIDPVTQSYLSETKYRDRETYIAVRKKTGAPGAGCPLTTAATQGTLTGSIAIIGTLDLSGRYILAIAIGTDAEFVEVNCAGVIPSQTTLTEIIDNLNNAGFGTIASAAGNYLKLEAPGLGENSILRIKQPRIADTDCIGRILGEPESPGYIHIYQGENKWFKIAEVQVPAGIIAIPTTHIATIDQQASWTEEQHSIRIMKPYADTHRIIERTELPIGTIIPVIPGYFTDGNNGSFVEIAVHQTYGTGWYTCDGTEPNDPDSPVFNQPGRHVPNVSDDRFLMGSSLIGQSGGTNSNSHSHGTNTQLDSLSLSHNHTLDDHDHAAGTLTTTGGMNVLLNEITSEFRFYESITGGYLFPPIIARYGSIVSSRDWNSWTFLSSGIGISGATATPALPVETNNALATTSLQHSHTSNSQNNTENRPLYLSCRYIVRIK